MTGAAPPRLAAALVALAAGRAARDAALGDLEEEMARAAAIGNPRRWYWRQALQSSLHFGLRRFETNPLLPVVMASLVGYLMIFVWDMAVARNAARLVGQSAADAPLYLLRGVYILVQMIAVAAAGALVARLSFDARAGFWRNASLRLVPLGAALALPVLYVMILGGDRYPAAFRIAWFAAAAPALLAGAWAGMKLRR